MVVLEEVTTRLKGADWFVNCAETWEVARTRRPAMIEALILKEVWGGGVADGE